MTASTRRVHRPRPATLRLWSTQSAEVWEKLQREGSLLVDPTYPNFCADFVEAYDWLREQLRQRIPGYQGGYPWWGDGAKQDLRRVRHWHETGTPFVRLELAIEPERVLFSGFSDWHFALNDWYLADYEMRTVDGESVFIELETPPDETTADSECAAGSASSISKNRARPIRFRRAGSVWTSPMWWV